jgi:OmpA-OmpF porin, OOP family
MRRGLPLFRSSRIFGALIAASWLGHAGTAGAQVAVGNEFNAQRFDAAAGPRNYLTTRGARTDGEMAWSAGLLLNYANEPIVVRGCVSATDCEAGGAQGVREIKVVENLFEAALLGSLTPIPRLQIGLKLPLSYAKGHGMSETGQPDELAAFALADPEIEVKMRAVGEAKDPVVLGAALYGTIPTGHLMAERAYLGDETPGGGLRAILDADFGQFGFGANIGGVLRGTGSLGEASVDGEVRPVEVGSEFRYSAAVGWRPSPVIRVLVDYFGSTRFATTPAESPMEIEAAVQVTPLGSPIVITAGGGTRLVTGLGAPTFRALLGFTYFIEKSDRDNDGLDDNDDQCPTEAEDRDSYEDSDGCPEADNDLDTIPDSADKCPGKPEDADGFEDMDGCPDPDNDKDGIKDDNDNCKDKPETMNGFDDTDGCPDVSDKDRDGVPDDKDQCIDQAEDTDGFEDTDGCPDADNDKDGVPDDQDECVDEPETVNKFEDTDGCPDDPRQRTQRKPKAAPAPAAPPAQPKPGEVLEL